MTKLRERSILLPPDIRLARERARMNVAMRLSEPKVPPSLVSNRALVAPKPGLRMNPLFARSRLTEGSVIPAAVGGNLTNAIENGGSPLTIAGMTLYRRDGRPESPLLRGARAVWERLKFSVLQILLFPASLSMMSIMPWTPGGETGGANPVTPKLKERMDELETLGVKVSARFIGLIASGDMNVRFAETLIFGLIDEMRNKRRYIRQGDTLSSVATIQVAMGKMEFAGLKIAPLFSDQFKAELMMSGRTLEAKHLFAIIKEGETTYVALRDEMTPPQAEETERAAADDPAEAAPEEDPMEITSEELPQDPEQTMPDEPALSAEAAVLKATSPASQEGEVIDAEFVEVASAGDARGTPPASPDVSMSGEGGGALALMPQEARGGAIAIPSRERLHAIGLPAVGAIHALAAVSPELAGYSITGLLQLELSTDTQKVADAIRVIKLLLKHAGPEDKKSLLKKLADIFLVYDEAQKAESSESTRRIKREIIGTLKDAGIRPSFVHDIDTYVGGKPEQRAVTLQSLASSLLDEKWGTPDGLEFARYLTARIISAEIRRGTDKTILSAAVAAIKIVPKEIIAEGEVEDFVRSIITRALDKDIADEQSMIYSGLASLVEADPAVALPAIEAQIKDNMFLKTDVLIYRLLARFCADPAQRAVFAEWMASDYTEVIKMERPIRRALREAIVTLGEEAIPAIVSACDKADKDKHLTSELRNDLMKMIDEITAKLPEGRPVPAGVEDFIISQLKKPATFDIIVELKLLHRPGVSAGTKQTVFERAAGNIYDYRTTPDVLKGINALDSVHGVELLQYFKERYSAATNDPERRFYVGRMAAKIAALSKASGPEQETLVEWTFDQALTLFNKFGSGHFEIVKQLFASRVVSNLKIQRTLNNILTRPKDPSFPGRDRALMLAVAENYGIAVNYLMDTVFAGFVQMAEGLFEIAEKSSGAALTTQGRTKSTTSVVIPADILDHEKDERIGKNLRKRLKDFASASGDKYDFAEKTGTLSVKGAMTKDEFDTLFSLMNMTDEEEQKVPKWELITTNTSLGYKGKRRVEERWRAIGKLLIDSAAKEKRNTDSAASSGYVPTMRLDDVELAAGLSDAAPIKRFEEIVGGIIKLYLNPYFRSDKKDPILKRLMELHDWAVQGACARGEKPEDWSFAVIRPLVGMFFSGDLAKSTLASMAFKFIVVNMTNGTLGPSARATILAHFGKFLGLMVKRNMAGTVSYLANAICAAIEAEPAANWTAEKAFLEKVSRELGDNAEEPFKSRLEKLVGRQ